MSSNLKVNTILPSTGTTIGIGTVGGLINVVGNIDVNSTSGISTFNGLEISGIVTAKAGAAVTYYGDGSNLTGITDNVVTINNNANNRIITGSGSANTLEGEANLTFNGGATGDAQLTVHAEQNDSGADSELILETSNDFATSVIMFKDSTAEAGSVAYNHGDNYIKFSTNGTNGGTERVRIDSAGTLLVAHTSQRNNFNSAASTEHAPIIQLEGTNQKRAISITAANQDGGILMLARQNGSVGANTVVSSGNQIGRVDFQASGGTNMEVAAQISAEVDGTPGDNDMPGRLLFKTTADGANSATTRVEIKQHGRTQVNLPSTSGSSSAISTAQAIVGTKHIHTVYHNFNSTNSGLVISNVIPTNSAGTVDIMGGWANGNGIIFKRFAWCASGDSHITQVFSTAASRYGVSVSISTPTIAISGDYANFTFTFSDSQGSKMEKLKIHFEYHKQFYVI